MMDNERRKSERRNSRDTVAMPDVDPRRINIERRILNLDVHSIAEWLERPPKMRSDESQSASD